MTDNKITTGMMPKLRTHDAFNEPASASMRSRIVAHLRAGHFDRILAVGAPPHPDSALAVHAVRLTSRAEREAVARALRRAADDAGHPTATLTLRVPLHWSNVAAASELIDAVTLRLHSPRPVGVRGMARLRVLLSDGAGPLYRYGRGDLIGRLGAALAEL